MVLLKLQLVARTPSNALCICQALSALFFLRALIVLTGGQRKGVGGGRGEGVLFGVHSSTRWFWCSCGGIVGRNQVPCTIV